MSNPRIIEAFQLENYPVIRALAPGEKLMLAPLVDTNYAPELSNSGMLEELLALSRQQQVCGLTHKYSPHLTIPCSPILLKNIPSSLTLPKARNLLAPVEVVGSLLLPLLLRPLRPLRITDPKAPLVTFLLSLLFLLFFAFCESWCSLFL